MNSLACVRQYDPELEKLNSNFAADDSLYVKNHQY